MNFLMLTTYLIWQLAAFRSAQTEGPGEVALAMVFSNVVLLAWLYATKINKPK